MQFAAFGQAVGVVMAGKVTRAICLTAMAMAAAACALDPDAPTPPEAAASNQDPAGAGASAASAGDGGRVGYAVPAGETLATFTASEVIAMLMVASSDAIAQASFAQLRADNPEVKAFAERIVTDQARVIARLAPMRTPSAAPDLTSALLQREDQLVELDLRTQQGGQLFELAYLTAQVTAHAKIIAMLDRSLMPSVSDASRALRSAVGEVRTLYVRRLVEALDLQRRVLRSEMTSGAADNTGIGSGRPPSNPPRLTAPK
jgi:predicted outer membrane protein